jgi:hypothetical protein
MSEHTSLLPTPDNWRELWLSAAFASVFFGAPTVVFATHTVAAAETHRYLAATITAGLTVFTLGLLAIAAATLRRLPVLRARPDAEGVTLPSDPLLSYLLGASLAGALIGTSLHLISEGRDRNLLVAIALLVGSALGLAALIRRRGLGYLRLTPQGVEVADLARTRTVAWPDIVAITDRVENKRLRQPISLLVGHARPVVVQHAGSFAPNGAALYWMLRHYWNHPEARAELAGGRALERLRTERFDIR